MKKRVYIHFWIFILIFISFSFAQEKIFIPRNIQAAYDKGTRSPDGKPGADYWQNSADYRIQVEVDPDSYSIVGTEEITYYNNSPDSLTRILLRLYPNIFKKGSARDYSINPEGITEGVTVSRISVNNRSINLENRRIYRVINTVAIIYLPEAVQAKSSVNISVDWSFRLNPKSNLRMGIYDSTTVFVGYWYPQVSVYDDVEGWDYYNYSGQVEFYNDFSNFDVSITLPNSFGVWATGELQNPEQVLNSKFLERYFAAKNSEEVVRIITADDLNSSEIFNGDRDKNTWIYSASNVSDFAFAFSDKYLWDGVKAIIDSSSNESVFVQAVYPLKSPDFFEVAEISKELIRYFSFEMPGIKFPFPSIVAFNNGRTDAGGMEFPMMINDASLDIREQTISLTAHELAHQYFPFYVGTNEKKYAFMDEGWAVFLPFRFMERLTDLNARLINVTSSYEFIAGTEDDIPMMIPSLALPYGSYRNSAYDKSAIAYEFLRDILGDDLFLKSLKEYINRWKFKHPTPYDFFFTFNDVAEQDLNWFWNLWFFEFGYPDLSLEKVTLESKNADLLIRKIGNIPTPIKLTVIYEDDSMEEYYFTAEIWKDGNETASVKIELSGILKSIELGDTKIPDSNRENNLYLVH